MNDPQFSTRDQEDFLQELHLEQERLALTELDREARHRFQNCRTAARLAMGALQAGAFDDGVFVQLMERLAQVEGISFDTSQYLEKRQKFNPYGSSGQRQILKLNDEEKILVVDDEVHTAGWDIFFSRIFGEDRCLFAADQEAALDILDKDHDIALLFLDLKLPKHVNQGLELLKAVRLARLDLPIVVFTAENSSQHVRSCFDHGADAYFAKELSEADKTPAAYYRKFAEVTFASLGRRRYSDLWRRISALQRQVREQGPPYHGQLFAFLRKAYFFLTLDTGTITCQVLSAGKDWTPFGEAALQCALALESRLKTFFREYRNNGALKEYLTDLKDTGLTLGKMIDALANIGAIGKEERPLYDSVNNIRKKVVHAEKGNKTLTVREKDAADAFRNCLAALETSLLQP